VAKWLNDWSRAIFPTGPIQQPAPVLTFILAYCFTSCVRVVNLAFASNVKVSQNSIQKLCGVGCLRMLA
jgi:hypothetical protein